MTFLKSLACLFALVISFAVPALSQDSNSGSIAGTVHDATGALVPGAAVTVTNDHGFSQTVTSDDQGNYVVTGLPAGTYKITVALQGFKTLEVPSVVVTAGETDRADANLEVLGATASVNVVGQRAAQVETEDPEISGTITQQEVTAIGLNGRNFTQLITLAPGVSNQTGQDEALVGVKGSVKYSVNGGRVEYNNFDVDGSDVLNAGVNGSQSTLVVYPSLDAIQEIKVLTSNYGAQYGRSASGTVLVTTKSGGDHFHGDAYEFLRNELFNAKNYFDIFGRPLYRRNDFGFTLGGPLFIPGHYNTKKDKTFFFYSQEFRLEKTPQEFNQGVPSIEERYGNFADVCPFAPTGVEVYFKRSTFPDCPASGLSGSIGYYLTCPGNQLTPTSTMPSCTLDPNAVALLNTGVIPLPNSTTGCNSSIRSCYDFADSLPTYWQEELFRIDHNFTPNVRGTLRFIDDNWNTTTAIPQWGFIQNSFPTVENYFTGPGLDVVAHLTQIFSPTLVSDLMFSFTTNHITLTDENGPAATWRRPEGLTMGSLFPCTAANPATCFGGKVPGIVVAGTNAAYGGSGFSVDPSFEPFFHNSPTYSVGDNITKTAGTHTLQVGAQVVLAQRNEVNPAVGAATGDVQGIVSFSNISSLFTTGNAFADFLSGQIKSFQQDSAQGQYDNRYTTVEPYFQDDWKLSSRLTVNLGLRVSLFGTWYEEHLTGYNWEPSAFSAALASQAAVDPRTGVLLDVPSCTNVSQPPILGPCNAIPLNLQNLDPRITNGLVQCGTNGLSRSCMKGHLFNPAPRVGFAWDPRGDGKMSIRAGYGIFYEHGTGNEANIGSLEGSAPLVLDMTESFTQGYASIGATGAAFPLNVTSIPSKAVWPYVQQWNLSVQRELAPDIIASAGYVGSKGTHLTAELQINQLQPVSPNQNPFTPGEPLTTAICDTFDGSNFTINEPTSSITISSGNPAFVNMEAACNGATNKVPNPNSLREFAPTIGQIFSLQNVANSSYNAFQFTLRRAKAPLTLELAYSYSHSIDDSSDRFDSTLANAYDLRENRASSNFDQRNLLNLSYVYDFSLLRLGQELHGLWNGQIRPSSATSSSPGASSFWSRVLDDWELSGVTTYQSGTPFSVINGGSGATGISVLDNPGVASGTGAGSYPDKVQDPRFNDPLTYGANSALFTFGPLLQNPNQFMAPQGLTFGDAGRNSLNNPSRLNFDMALLKHFRINESANVEFRAEAFNIFNHTQFRIYDPDRGNNANNVISCYGGPNDVAGYVGGDTNCLEGNAFLRPIDAHRPRTIQFGLKMVF